MKDSLRVGVRRLKETESELSGEEVSVQDTSEGRLVEKRREGAKQGEKDEP